VDDISDTQLFAVCLVSAILGFGVALVFFDASGALLVAIAVYAVVMSALLFLRGYRSTELSSDM